MDKATWKALEEKCRPHMEAIAEAVSEVGIDRLCMTVAEDKSYGAFSINGKISCEFGKVNNREYSNVVKDGVSL